MSTDSTVERVNPQQLAGTWHRRSLSTDSVNMTLSSDGAYKAAWTGCFGTNGTATGTWSATPEYLTLNPRTETGMMENHLRSFCVIPHKKGLVLVPPDERDEFEKGGPEAANWCFSRSR